MLMSFMATMEDGYYLSSAVERKAARSRKGRTKVAGEGGLGRITSLLGLKTTVSGQYEKDSSLDSDVVESFVREHTAASMFNRLHENLEAAGLIKRPVVADSLYELHHRDIVEISGTVTANPLETLFETLTRVLPIALLLNAFKGSTSAGQAQNALENPVTKDLLERLREDFASSPVTDVALDAEFCRIIITAKREFLTESARASLVDGSFTTLGKITKLGLRTDDSVSLIRRGSLAAFGQIQVEMESLLASTQGKLEMPPSEIRGPYIQILPLGIYA